MDFQPEFISRWKLPPNYGGAEWREYYSAGVGQTRDSDCLEQSNFAAMLRDLGGESDTVQVVRESHWAVGWIEWIAIHQTDEERLRIADENLRRLEAYPILDEDDHSSREWEAAAELWENCYRPRDRAHYLRSRRCLSGFRLLRAAVAGDWSAAAQLLPSPTEILY